jgi:hypothetical protein
VDVSLLRLIVVRTNEIIHGRHNKIYHVELKEVLTWYPADYTYKCGKCLDDVIYHTCAPIYTQWQYVLHNIIYPNEVHYGEVYRSIMKNGFIGPIRARITENDHVVVLDGHNRVGVALDLSLKTIPVYVGDKNADIYDLRAPDSGWWQEHNEPWIII